MVVHKEMCSGRIFSTVGNTESSGELKRTDSRAANARTRTEPVDPMLVALTTPALSIRARMIFAWMVGRVEQGLSLDVAVEDIKRDLKIRSDETVYRAIYSLEEEGHLIVHRHQGSINSYELASGLTGGRS